MISRNRNVIAILNEDGLPRNANIRIRPGMIMAQDVFNAQGFLLCSTNTRLNQYLVDVFAENGIHWARAYSAEQAAENFENINEDLVLSAVIHTEEFQEFKVEYAQKVNEIKDQLIYISAGGDVDLDALHGSASDIMSTLESKNDVFNYIRFMKQTDEATYGHCINVSMLCSLFGYWLGLKQREVVDLTAAGSLHDIGKTKVPFDVLSKRGRLTEDEFSLIKNHTVLGYELLKDRGNLPDDIKLAALMHHERIDGSGYPHGKIGRDINRYASIVTICDIYDAMISNRCYKERLSPFYVIKTFEQGFYGHLHTEYLLIFLRNIAQTFLHSKVVLTDGSEGVVVFINEKHLSRPIVRCGSEFIDLMERTDLDVKIAL